MCCCALLVVIIIIFFEGAVCSHKLTQKSNLFIFVFVVCFIFLTRNRIATRTPCSIRGIRCIVVWQTAYHHGINRRHNRKKPTKQQPNTQINLSLPAALSFTNTNTNLLLYFCHAFASDYTRTSKYSSVTRP